MSEYIKREDAIDAVMSTEPVVFDAQSLEPHQKTKDVVTAIEQLPSADVVEVVRCKDCKYRHYYTDGDGWYCGVTNNCLMRDENFYCSYGERKDDEDK